MTPSQDTAIAAIIHTIPSPSAYMCGLTWDGTRLWYSDQDQQTIYAIDSRDGTVSKQFRCPHVRADLAFDGTHLLQVGGRPKQLVRVDPESGEIVGMTPVEPASGRLTGVEMGPEGIWMLLRAPMVVQLRDYATMEVRQEFPAYGESPSGLTYAGGTIVYGDFDDGVLRAMDPRTGTPLGETPVPGRPTGLTWDGENVWYCDFPGRSFRALSLSSVVG